MSSELRDYNKYEYNGSSSDSEQMVVFGNGNMRVNGLALCCKRNEGLRED